MIKVKSIQVTHLSERDYFENVRHICFFDYLDFKLKFASRAPTFE